MKKVNLETERKMIDLYNQGDGTSKIAKKLNLGNTCVRKYLIKNNVVFRRAPKDVVSQDMHDQIVKLYNAGNPMKKISKMLGINLTSINRHLHKEGNVELKKRGNPNKINPNAKELTLEKSYVLGVIGPGDGFIENYNGCRIALEATDLDFINYFASCLEKVYGIKPSIKELKKREGDSKRHYKVRIYSKEAYNDVLSYNTDFKEKTWRVPQAIKEAPKEIQIKYLQGFADSQGCVSERAIILCNQNKEGLKEVKKLFGDIGIPNIKESKNGLVLCDRKSVEGFNQLVNFNIVRKKESLIKVVGNYKVWKTLQEDILKIEPKIIELRKQGLSYPQIAKLCNIPISTAWRHSKEYGINHINQYL